eukprot:s2014_g2.t1
MGLPLVTTSCSVGMPPVRETDQQKVYNVDGSLPSLFVWLGGLAVILLAFGLVKVTRQTRVAALSAGRLTIPKAVAYFDNQLGMGRTAALRRHGHKLPKGPSVISAPGESFEAVMLLELRAFMTDPRRKLEEAVSITVKCRSQHCEVVQQLVKNAWGVQLRLLENQVLAEERCLALRWNQRDCVKETLTMFQETLLFYTMQAVAEQVMHCPEVMNTLFHLLLSDDTEHILRFDLMCKMLDEYIHNSDPFYLRGLTLDDLNDSVPRRLGKTNNEALERRLKNCTYKGGMISKMYPARGIFAGLKLALDFRPAIELKSPSP